VVVLLAEELVLLDVARDPGLLVVVEGDSAESD
jgi:hypothetical protein